VTWNYRVWKTEDGYYTIRETHYDDEGKVKLCTENGIGYSESVEELTEEMKMITRALKEDVVVEKEAFDES